MRVCTTCHRNINCNDTRTEIETSARIGTCQYCHRDTYTFECDNVIWSQVREILGEQYIDSRFKR